MGAPASPTDSARDPSLGEHLPPSQGAPGLCLRPAHGAVFTPQEWQATLFQKGGLEALEVETHLPPALFLFMSVHTLHCRANGKEPACQC